MRELDERGDRRRGLRVHKTEWVLEADSPPHALAQEARARTGLDAQSWQRVLWHGGVHLDNRRLRADDELIAAGARVRVYAFAEEPPAVELPADAVLHDAGGVIAINKPAGMPTQPTPASNRLALEDCARRLLGCEWLFALNRLDTGTSGVVLLARTPEAAAVVRAQFDARQVEKRYLAWVAPAPRADAWRVRGYVVQVPHPEQAHYALRTAPCEGGRDSLTDFEVVQRRADSALVSCVPHTGRSHQLRLHLSAGHSPIIGDRAYGSVVDAPRPLLHSLDVRLCWPGEEQCRRVTAPMPPDFAR